MDEETRALGGLEQLRALRAPPAMFHLTGITFDSAAPREAEFSMPITGWLRAPQGAVPGGLLAVPADGALGCAIHTDLAAGTMYTTAELSITYLRPARVGVRAHATGHAIHVGRSLALSSCNVTDAGGALLAYATSRCLVGQHVRACRRHGRAHRRGGEACRLGGRLGADPWRPSRVAGGAGRRALVD
ncbi:MAG: PaaI family thioesterase [Candidatus Dormibacteraeota bacterium]|nr:PaaI family thioesterase [Candidatus Dormibacteraeota bacterium]